MCHVMEHSLGLNYLVMEQEWNLIQVLERKKFGHLYQGEMKKNFLYQVIVDHKFKLFQFSILDLIWNQN